MPYMDFSILRCFRSFFSGSKRCILSHKSVKTSQDISLPSYVLSKRVKQKQIPQRTGLLARKRGMTAVWTQDGERIPVTVLQVDRLQVIEIRTKKNNGYNAVQVGMGSKKAKNISKAMLGHFAKAGVPPKSKIVEFRTKEPIESLVPGTQLYVNHFKEGAFVDIRGKSIGKGFAGVMKRWNFHGLPASHGVSISHRSAGSMGQSQDPGRVLPGKKMAGRMGGKNVTIQNVPIIKIDHENGLILVKGSVPGPDKGYVTIRDAIKKTPPNLCN
ncbi:50S ribosomal protein L3 [Pneumocystis carinii B80]|uniref:Large ribosomal subunit protein uL3m n=1 Tax=Pneumocystis carinii (strain B80) TaxID=1408658 RepID=A0A0W4ZEH9_PNEC8|nr:50S ribosomal protein L3 [Pneumocystis carinii B80]KTW26754.1 50S ribosomal protein L3 [Pneumocystis carinii B80]